MFALDIALSRTCDLSRLSRLRLYLLNFAAVNSTEEFDNSLTVFTGAGFVASGVALWNIAVVEPLEVLVAMKSETERKRERGRESGI